jgi:hypothetical protein
MSLYPVTTSQRESGIDLFNSVRRKAQLAKLIDRLLHRFEPLPDFGSLSHLQSKCRSELGLQEVPVSHIIGSINRKGDFDRHFRPLRKHLRDRWVNIFLLMQSDGWEPVTLYKVRDSYYVEDGHHRISVAQVTGKQFIEAQVWEYRAAQQSFIPIPAAPPALVSNPAQSREECVSA